MIALLLAACATNDLPLSHSDAPRQWVRDHADDVPWIRAHRRWIERFAATGDARSLTNGDWAIDALAKLPGDEGLDALRAQLDGPSNGYAALALARRPDGCAVLYEAWQTSEHNINDLTVNLARGSPSCVDTLHLTEPALLRAYRAPR